MKPGNYFKITFLALVLTACGGSAPPAPPVVVAPIAEEPEKPATGITWETLTTATPAQGEIVMIEGYVGDIGTYVSSSNGEYGIPVYQRRNQAAGTKLNVYTFIGKCKNCVASLPDNFGPEDYKIYCDDSTVVTTGDKVRVTIELNNSSTPGYFSGDGIKIEAIEDDFDGSVFAEAVPLTNAMVADTADAEVYCYVTGKLAVPSMIFSLDNSITLDLNSSSVKEVKTVKVAISSSRPSTMSNLPDNYTSKDLVVRDYTGQPIPAGVSVKIYGLWTCKEIYSGEKMKMFYPEEFSKN